MSPLTGRNMGLVLQNKDLWVCFPPCLIVSLPSTHLWSNSSSSESSSPDIDVRWFGFPGFVQGATAPCCAYWRFVAVLPSPRLKVTNEQRQQQVCTVLDPLRNFTELIRGRPRHFFSFLLLFSFLQCWGSSLGPSTPWASALPWDVSPALWHFS